MLRQFEDNAERRALAVRTLTREWELGTIPVRSNDTGS